MNQKGISLLLSQSIRFLIACSIVSCTNFIKKSDSQPIFLRINASFDQTSDLNLIKFIDIDTLDQKEVRFKTYHLENDLNPLKEDIQKFRTIYKNTKKQKDLVTIKQFVTAKETVKPYNEFDLKEKTLDLASQKILSLIDDYQKSQNEDRKYQIKQVTTALYHRYTPPIKTDYEILEMPFIILKQFNFPHVEINNVLMRDKLSPEISAEFIDLTHNEKELFSLNHFSNKPENCQYLKAKSGYGVHTGFQIQCSDETYKVKFGNEIYSGPFNSRLYTRLGYTVPIINYFENLKVRYDRRIFSEFNNRLAMNFEVTLAYQKLYGFTNKDNDDAFAEINFFVFKNGKTIEPYEVKNKLLLNPKDQFNYSDSNINKDFEDQIESIIFKPLTLTEKNNDKIIEVGPWSASDLNYSKLSEVREMIILSAWVGNYDVRKDNLRVFLLNPRSDQPIIKVGFADAGSGLGHSKLNTDGIFNSSDINKMDWEISSRYKASETDLSQSDQIQLTGFMSVEANSNLQYLNLNEAQNSLERLCQISKTNLHEALIASGMSSAEVVLATEKLLNRRNKMLADFEVSDDLKKSCFIPTNTKINYDPKKDGLISVMTTDGNRVTAPDRGKTIANGSLR